MDMESMMNDWGSLFAAGLGLLINIVLVSSFFSRLNTRVEAVEKKINEVDMTKISVQLATLTANVEAIKDQISDIKLHISR